MRTRSGAVRLMAFVLAAAFGGVDLGDLCRSGLADCQRADGLLQEQPAYVRSPRLTGRLLPDRTAGQSVHRGSL
jgi:hypothetical protein